MSDDAESSGTVSWELFNDLYESEFDLLRKLRFFISAGRSEELEQLALDIMEELLSIKERELEVLRQRGLEEWTAAERRVTEGAARSGNLLVSGPQGETGGPLDLPQRVGAKGNTLWGKLVARIK